METDVVLGDARLTLARAQPGTYDLLVIDAFNSDAQRLRGGGDHGLLPAESERSAATSIWIVLAREPGVVPLSWTGGRFHFKRLPGPLSRS
jgi:hypothetical protein